jgi:hypothetical protein
LKLSIFGGTVLLCTQVICTSATAFGRDDQWQSGFGQGVCESIITSGSGNEIYVACDCGSNQPSSISFQLTGRDPIGDNVFLSFDNQDAESIWISDGSIGSDCRACASTFNYVIDKLKKHSRVRVMYQNGDAATFSLKGSAEAIGECISDF